MNNRHMRTQSVPGPLLSFGRRGLGTRLYEGLAKPATRLVSVMSFANRIHVVDVIVRTEAVHYILKRAAYCFSNFFSKK